MYELNEEQENKEISNRYKNLLQGTYEKLSNKDLILIRKAFDLALDAHKNQRRKSGEPYIFHPIAVAKIIAAQIGLGSTAIAAALLHDVVEDTIYTQKDILESFGESVAKVVEGLTKISKIDKKKSLQLENYKKLLLTMGEDPRVILIKIADRLHNMQTMESMISDKQKKNASETLYIYAPLADRLGLHNIKSNLEDLSLKYLEPSAYKNIQEKIIFGKEKQEKYLQYFSKQIETLLKNETDLEFKILSRSKSIYSIHKKMFEQAIDFEDVFDRFAIRIIYKTTPKKEKLSAWEIYSTICNVYSPHPERMRDWITQPKNTGYEALHITVMGYLGRWVEIQIRSERMDEIAEMGYAAHFKYKDNQKYSANFELGLDYLKSFLKNKEQDTLNFVEDFKENLFTKEIFVFTPHGDIKSLPKNATALDFAFVVHTEVGLCCRGVKINGKIKSLDTVLKSGDQVEILISKIHKIVPSWLEIVKTTRAKNTIQKNLKIKEKEIFEQGKEILQRKIKKIKLKLNDTFLRELMDYFGFHSLFELFYKVGNGSIDNQQIRFFLRQRNRFSGNLFKNNPKKLKEKNDLIRFEKQTKAQQYILAKCCNPVEGQEIFGLKKENTIFVHSHFCENALKIHSQFSNQIIPATWENTHPQEFKITLKINGSDKKGILGAIIKKIEAIKNIHIYKVHMDTKHNIFEGNMDLGIQNMMALEHLIKQLKKMKDIENVKRIQ